MTQLALIAPERPVPEVVHGQIVANDSGWVLDAEPFVMIRCRPLLNNATNVGQGKYTHGAVVVPRTADYAKDLLWINERYPMEIEDPVWMELNRMAMVYDYLRVAAKRGDTDTSFNLSKGALTMAEPPREHQTGYRNLHRAVRRLLNADCIGGGKTISHIATLCEPDNRPALIVVQPHLLMQWKAQINRFLPGASVQVLKSGQRKKIEPVDVVLVSYSSLRTWQDVLVPHGFKSVGFDEVQELRHLETEKRRVAKSLSSRADFVAGYSATPIYNYGAEVWSVLDVINPGSLGPIANFTREWCTMERVRNPQALHGYLKKQGLMIRRTYKDIFGEGHPVAREVVTLDGDLETLHQVRDAAKALALSVLSNKVEESSRSARELDWKLRQATGLAKAKPVAEFVKMLCESGEKVLLFGWHRDVYEIWLKALRAYNPVMCTGTESPTQKNAAKHRFMTDPDCKVFICSLRSGSGIDGLQLASHIAVFGELDWSPHAMDQDIGRLDREGQESPVIAYFLTIDDGADPFMIERLGDKRSQHEGIFDGEAGNATVLDSDSAPADRLRALAEAYLAMIGEPIPENEPQTGLHAEVIAALRRVKLPTNTEAEMQEALWAVLPGLVSGSVEREVKVGERSRLDFLVSGDGERVAVECKIDQTGRSAVYRQVRRYAEEANVTSLIVLAPWSGVSNFSVEGVPVTVIDWAKAKL